MSTARPSQTQPTSSPPNDSTITDQNTSASAPQSPVTAVPAHQCRNCRASFCQPLSCGHVYCDECLGPRRNQSFSGSRQTGCPECERKITPPLKSFPPEPKHVPGIDVGFQTRLERRLKHI